MRILFFSHYFWPEGNAPATRVYELTRRWARSGHDVTVVTGVPNVPSGVPYEGYRNLLLQEERVEGVRTIRVWTYLAPNKGTFRRTLNYLSYVPFSLWASAKAPFPDVVIATSPQFLCGWAGAFASRLRRRHFVLEVRDIWPDSILAVEALRCRAIIRCLEALEMRLYRRTDRIVTVGDGYAESLAGKGVPMEHVSILPNGVDLEKFSPRDDDAGFRRRYGLGDSFVCIYAGTIGMAAGLEAVIGAAVQVKAGGRKDIRFVLAGDGADLERMRAAVERSNLDNVVITGRLGKEEVIRALSACNACLVHLKRTELFRTVIPSKIYEAAAMARPIILGVEGKAAELVKGHEAGICIEPENPRQLAEAVIRLADEPELARNLGRNGRERLAAKFDYNRLADDYLQILSVVLRDRALASLS